MLATRFGNIMSPALVYLCCLVFVMSLVADFDIEDHKSSVTGGDLDQSPPSSSDYCTANEPITRKKGSQQRNTSLLLSTSTGTHSNKYGSLSVSSPQDRPILEEQRPDEIGETPSSRPVSEDHRSDVDNDSIALSDRPPKVTSIRYHWKVLGGLCGFLAIVALVSIGFFAYINYNTSQHSELNKSVLVYKDTKISLVDHLLPFYLSNINLIETNSDSLEADIFFIDEACTSLSRNENVKSLNGIQQKSLQSFTGLYLLPGSFLYLNICAVTNSNHKNSSNPILVKMYVLDTLNETCIEHPTIKPPESYFVENIPVCYENDLKNCTPGCHVVKYSINQPAYYSIRFILNYPDLAITMTYNYSGFFREYLVEKPNREIVSYDCSFSETLGVPLTCSIPLNDSSYHLPWNINKEQCLLAVMHGSNDNSANISTIEIQTSLFSPSWSTISSICIGVSIGVFLVLCICEVCLCYCACRKKK